MQPRNKRFLGTSVLTALTTMMQQTHDRRGISIFSGPPGIGKTSAIDAFVADNPNQVVVVKIAKKNAGDRFAYQHMMEAFAQMAELPVRHFYQDSFACRQQICQWMANWGAGPTPSSGPAKNDNHVFPHLTFVFDEAQNLSRHAVDALRYWNDDDRCYGPFPIGVIFVGNDEFSLASDRQGSSVIAAAVADRALHYEQFTYAHVNNADLELFIRSNGITDANAVAAIIRRFTSPRAIRSFRALGRDIEELKLEAAGEPVTLATVQAVYNLA